MRIIKPSWIHHPNGDRQRNGTIFSLHVHPDGSRLATGGIDTKIRIWNTLPILDEKEDQVETAKEEVVKRRKEREEKRKKIAEEKKKAQKAAASTNGTPAAVDGYVTPNDAQLLGPSTVAGDNKVTNGDAQSKEKETNESASGDGANLNRNIQAIGNGHAEADASSAINAQDDVDVDEDEEMRTLGLDPKQDLTSRRLLCTLNLHNGPVLTVRWAHHGRYLASGADDGVVLIWDLDPSGGGRVWGSDDVNIENWKALKRLVGHESDVADLAWSRDDSMIASVGLDSKVFIWDGYTFEKLRQIDGHGGFVKGVCWDPIGDFLATQSDDKTVKVWRTSDWSLEKTISEPFKMSPSNTFFRRLSWSPDGTFIAASNAMNGPVFVSQVIERHQWKTEVSFVGHENTIEVAAFNPRLLFPLGERAHRGNASSIVALGGDDNTISIWKNTMKAPLAVIKDVFERSSDGLAIYGCSSDGTICTIVFDPEELPELDLKGVTNEIVESQAAKKPVRKLPPPLQFSAPSQIAMPTEAEINKLTARQKVTIMPGGKRRIQPTLVASLSSSSPLPAQTNGTDPFADRSGHADSADDLRALKRRRTDGDMLDISDGIGRVVGSEAPRVALPAVEIRATQMTQQSALLAAPVAQPKLVSKNEDNPEEWLQAQNSDGIYQITQFRAGATSWTDFVPGASTSIVTSRKYSAAALENSSVIVYSHRGDRMDSAISYMSITNQYLLVLSAKGLLRVWDLDKRAALFTPVSIGHLLEQPTSSNAPLSIKSVSVGDHGVAIVTISNGHSFAYDPAMMCWEEITSPWWATSSPQWKPHRAASNAESRLPLASLERAADEASTQSAATTSNQASATKRPSVWDEAVGLDHLESRLHASALLNSASEYRTALSHYAHKLAEKGYKARAEELVKELHGPVYYHAGRDRHWDPDVCGLKKRELLVDVLRALGRSKELADFAHAWQERMRQAALES